MIIDTHAHYLPQAMLEDLNNRRNMFPNIDCMKEDEIWKLGFAAGPLTRPILPKLRQADTRVEWMNKQRIDIMVCGGWLDSFGYEISDDEGKNWSLFINDHLLKACSETDRFVPLCSVPMQNGKMAAEVLERALDDGFHGAMIGTQPKGGTGNLDDPDLDPFWELASDRKVTIYLHPMFGCGDPRLNDFGLFNTVGRGLDTITAMSRLIFSGHLQKYYGMNFVLSHGGGGLPFLLGRMQINHHHNPELGDPRACLESCYYDTVVHDVKTLKYLCEMFGSRKIMMGSDYPFSFGDLEPCSIIEKTPLLDEDKKNILGDVAQRIFHIKNCDCKHR